MGPNIELPANTANGGEGTRPMMFYGSMVDGNMRFQPVPGMPGGMSAEGEQDTTNPSERGTGERGTGERGTGERGTGEEPGPTGRGNNIARYVYAYIYIYICIFFSILTDYKTVFYNSFLL